MKPCPTCRALCHDQARFCPSCGGSVLDVASTEADPFLGHVLADRYLLKRLIGEGGMGRVYEAEQRPLEKPVAVKILHQHLLGDEQSVARFVAEAREASRLNHPNIVSVIEFGETAYNVLFLVMEFLRGRPLSDVIGTEYPLAVPRILQIFRQILLALEAAHRLGVVHRDLKPDNVFIEALSDGTERVKVIDFGIAKRFDKAGTGLTSPGMVCGTPEYMSPEQVMGGSLDPRSDVYALGVLLYELLVGSPPFVATSSAEVMLMQAEDEPLAPSAVTSDVDIPPSLDAIVLWALAKNRDDRIGSAAEFRRVLDSWMLVSVQGDEDADTAERVCCPSCNFLILNPGPRCSHCGFSLPDGRPAEGMPFLVQSMGADRVRRMRESQAIPVGFALPEVAPATSETQRSPTLTAVQGYLPLVGRELELGWLLRGVEAGGSLRLVGAPGLGKSRLLDEVASRATSSGWAVLRLAPRDDPHWPSPLGPIQRLVAELLDLAEPWGTTTLQGAVKALGLDRSSLIGLRVLLGVPTPPGRRLDRAAQQRESLAALRDLVQLRASRRSLAILLEDVDVMDAPSQRMVSYLQALPAQRNLLVLGSQSTAPREGDGVPTMELGPLGRDESVRLVMEKRRGEPLGSEIQPLMEVAGGNPFYLDQLVRLGQEGGLPEKVSRPIELLDARLDRLPMHLRQALQRVAVHGGRAPLDVLGRAFPQVEEEQERDLADLETLGLLETGSGWVATSHGLVEEAVIAAMPAEIRREAHQRFLALIPLGPRTVGAAVRHAVGSEDDQLAIEALDFGAGVAWSLHDVPRAIQWLQLGLHKSRLLWGRGELGMAGNARVTAELARKLGWVLGLEGELGTAEAVLAEVQTLLDEDQPCLKACLLMDQASLALERGLLGHAEEQLAKALKSALRQVEATWLHVELLYRMATVAVRRGHRERALTLLAEGFRLAAELDTAGHGEAWRFQVALGELNRDEGQRDLAESFFENARLSADRAGVLSGVVKAQMALGELLAQAGHDRQARDLLADALEGLRKLGDRGAAAQLMLRLGELVERSGEPGPAADVFERAQVLARAVDLQSVALEAEARARNVTRGSERLAP